ncbi:MAG TPA: hypothetical protein VN615_18680 [Gaiellales bacterium]|nr:hypothetical protein [Gaiellales bacterium]
MPNAPRRPGSQQPAPESDAPAAIDPLAYNWLVALGMMTIGAIAGMLFLHYRNPPTTSSAVSLGAVAGLFVLVAAIERVLEPLVHFDLLGADPASRAVRCLGLAAALAMLACGFFGFGVVHAFGDSATPRYIDIIVTGLGIGALTKPWHDLIRGIERWAHPLR